MWLFCSGSLIPNIMADDDAGEDAAYGTVGHQVGEEWLLGYENVVRDRMHPTPTQEYTGDDIEDSAPTYLIGRVVTVKGRKTSFDITIDAEMLAYVREYVEWCVSLPGTHYVETRVNYENLTPIPGQGGTADHAACSPGLLVITDLKMGQGIKVYAKWNTQALLYAYGFFREYDFEYDFQTIEIRICQPRLEHFDTWTVTREELLEFVATVPEKALAAWVPNAPRTPGPKQCQWCKIATTCAARLAWLEDAFDEDSVFENEETEFDEHGAIIGTYSVVDMEASQNRLLAGKSLLPTKDPGEMPTSVLAKLLPFRKQIEKFFNAVHVELTDRAHGGEEVPGYKVVDGREGDRQWIEDTDYVQQDLEFMGLDEEEMYERKLKSPAQITELLHKKFPGLSKKNAALSIADLVTRSGGKPTLVQDADTRDAQEDPGDVFIDESL